MPAIWETWKDRFFERLVDIRLRFEYDKSGMVYTALCAAALSPLLQAAHNEGFLPVAQALLNVGAGVGGNLIAEQLQRWKDQSDSSTEAQIAAWIEAQATTNTDLRQAMDAILEHLQAIQHAQEGLSKDDRQWFVQTLRQELQGMGTLARFEAHLSGSGAIAHGERAAAAGRSGIANTGNIGGDVLGPGATKITIHQSTSDAPAGLREAYLSWLMAEVQAVPLAGVDPKSVSEETRRDLDLAAVYTALMTRRTEATAREWRPDRDVKSLSALAVLNAEPRLALLGDPGSGKSTFVNFVVLCMAGELLGHTDANLQVLRSPVPGNDGERARPQPWHHGPLLPMHVVLREFVARALSSVKHDSQVSGGTLWEYIVGELPITLRDFAQPLRQELLETGGLLLLDGLDEVPEADARRLQVKTAVEEFAAMFRKVRVLVTSRTYASQQQDWKLRGFTEAVLAPFEKAQIRRFVERWYAYVGPLRSLSPEDAQGRAVRLNDIITRNPRLYELATRPLLLTLMASLHAWRGGTLPEQREQLYDDAVNLLLNRLAFAAHRDQQTLVGTADIHQNQLVEVLMALQQNPDVRPQRLLEYLRDRAGLLGPHGVDMPLYGPHDIHG